ncbi:MAG: hypothetical protein ACNA7V_12915, partial [Bacteroidales bacterium]
MAGQDRDYFSIEADAGYYYFFNGENAKNVFNYGFSLLVSKYVKRLRVGTGINYIHQSYDVVYDPPYSSVKSREYSVSYLTYPVLVNYEIYLQPKFKAGIITGFSLSRIIDYSIKSHNLDGEIFSEKVLKWDKNLNFALLFGASVSKPFSGNFVVNLSPFVSYYLYSEYSSQRPDYREVPFN